jgi:hypothetical protein
MASIHCLVSDARRWRGECVHLIDFGSSRSGMIATQLNSRVESQEITEFCVVRLLEHVCNVIQGKRVCIVLNLQVWRDRVRRFALF